MEVMPDHIHMLVEAPPKYAPYTAGDAYSRGTS
jgi:REP element-mobilizing transposase RayT